MGEKTKCVLVLFMSVVLVVGLMPLPALASPGLFASSFDASSEEYSELVGLQVNESSISLEAGATTWRRGVLWSYLGKGDVAVTFEGSVAPSLMLIKKGKTSGLKVPASSVAWKADGIGLARFAPGDLESAWVAETTDGVPNSVDDIRQMRVCAGDSAITVNRIVLTGAEALPGVTESGYVTDKPVRKLYTRNITLSAIAPQGDPHYRSVAIDTHNPVYDGATIAIRYTGAKPSISCYYTRNWNPSVAIGLGEGSRTVSVEGSSGERVTFFSWDDIAAMWEDKLGENPPSRRYMAIRPTSDGDDEGSGATECQVKEVVMIGGAERVDPTTSSNYVERTGMSAQEITRAMRAGYNMANHLESHWDPDELQPDGGWSRSDLELESHWSRGTYITRDTIRNLKKQGFKSVRLPTTWYQHIYPKGEPTGDPGDSMKYGAWSLTDRYHIDEAWMDRVQEVVDWCVAEDMFVILNIHHENWLNCDNLHQAYDANDRLPSEYKAVWTQIGDRFKDYDQHLILEGLNEPHSPYDVVDPETGKTTTKFGVADENSVAMVNHLNADFVSLMRGSRYAGTGNATRMLMVTTDNESGEIAYTGYVMPNDPANCLAQSVHCYSPHSWTHYLQGKDASVTGEDNVFTQQMRKDVDAAWEGIRSKWTSKGIPVVVGEFGCYYFGESREQDRVDWVTQFATHAKELGCPMLFWRMDRTTERDEAGWEHTIWASAFDEEQQKICDCSADMFAKWFEIVGDEAIEWGEYAEIEAGERGNIDEGAQLVDLVRENGFTGLPAKLVSREACRTYDDSGAVIADDGRWRIRFRATWDQLEGNQVAVRFKGDDESGVKGNTPRLITLTNKSSGDWWGLSPDYTDYDVESGSGIAYFKASSIRSNWLARGYSLDDLSYIGLCAADSGEKSSADKAIVTVVQQVAIIHCHEWGGWQMVKAATCAEEGEKTRTCANDSSHVLRRSTAVLDHEWEAFYTVDVPATYAATGSKSIHCAHCGAIKSDSMVVIPKLVVPSVKLKRVKAGKRSFTAKWKRAAGVSGYQLQYTVKKKGFKRAKKATVKKAAATSKKVKRLKAGKKYRVRIRAFAMLGGKKYYSTWSKVKAVKPKG